MGRPSLLTPERQQTIVEAISTGLTDNKTAATAAGIGERTFYDWLTRAEKDTADGIYSQFSQAVKEAQAAAEIRHLKIIDKAATGYNEVQTRVVEKVEIDKHGVFHDITETTTTTTRKFQWQASAWILERTYPQKYARAPRDEPAPTRDGDDYEQRLSSAGQSLAARLAEMKSATSDN